MATVLITGGTGMIGTVLTKELIRKNYEVIILTRSGDPKSNKRIDDNKLKYATWDTQKQNIDRDAIAAADHIIHLAGAGVADKLWTDKRKKEIVESRVKSSALLVKAMRDFPNKIKSVVSASAIGWYGPDPTVPNPSSFIETDPAFNDFLGQTCRQWEESIEPVAALGKRLVKLRTGIVLGKKGGALEEFKKPLRFGVASVLGNGKQMISWIHIDDLVRMYIDALQNESLHGAYNAVAPNPVTNKELILQLAKTKNKFFIPVTVPSFVLKIVLGEMSVEVLKSTTVSATKILDTGFSFQYNSIDSALKNLLV